MKKRKNKIPAFIPNRTGAGFMGLDQGKRDSDESQKNKENQKKLMLSYKYRKY
jgi:hypothetical protein